MPKRSTATCVSPCAATINAEFDIETFNGDIDNCFGPKPSRSREYGPGNELRFTQGKGDAQVRMKTHERRAWGSVSVNRRQTGPATDEM